MKKYMNVLVFITIIAGLSCKKQAVNQSANLEMQIRSWFAQQENPEQPLKASNVDLLLRNLDFSSISIEASGRGEKIIVVPVKEQFNRQKDLAEKYIPVVVLKLTGSGSVKAGNLVLFSPAKGQRAIPKNTFYNIFNTSHPNCDGTFNFLSVTGRRLYELTYDNGNLASAKRIINKDGSSRTGEKTCVDWYLVTTIYFTDGTIMETEEYLTTTCTGCDCGDIQCDCPDDDGSGNNSNNYEYEEERIRDGVIKWTLTELNAQLGSGQLKENSRVRGTFRMANPQNNCITNYYGGNIFLQDNSVGMDNISFSNITRSGSVLGCDLIRLSTAGSATFPGNIAINFSKTADFGFGQVIWN